MKLWIKIVIGIQTTALLFFIVLARIQVGEAEKQTVEAQIQAEKAIAAQQEAERMSEVAAMNAARADRAYSEAKEQAEIAKKLQADLVDCSRGK